MGLLRSTVGIYKNRLFYRKYDLKKNDYVLRNMKDCMKGRRCFLIGTGPSLNHINLTWIENEIKVGLNLAYKKVNVDYHFIAGWRILLRDMAGILSIPTTLFLSCSAGRYYLKYRKDLDKVTTEPLILRDYGEISVWKDISLDIENGVRGGSSVSFIALQVLLYMGFKEIYLLGHDCDYTTHGEHFYDKRRGEYERDWSDIFECYRIVREKFDDYGCTIYNATPNSKLDVFEKRQLEALT